VRLSSVSTDEVRKWGKWGLGDSDPICPNLKENPKDSAAFRRSWGNWGLRARVTWRRLTIFLVYAQKIMRLTPHLLLGHNGASRPHSPQTLIFCGVRRTTSQNRQAPSSQDGCAMAMTVIFCAISLGRRARTIEPRGRRSDRGPQLVSRRLVTVVTKLWRISTPNSATADRLVRSRSNHRIMVDPPWDISCGCLPYVSIDVDDLKSSQYPTSWVSDGKKTRI